MPICAIRYEDFLDDSSRAIRVMFNYCDLPEQWVEEASKAMLQDSQSTSPISKEKLKTAARMKLDMQEANHICSVFGLPNLEEENILAGTITYKR